MRNSCPYRRGPILTEVVAGMSVAGRARGRPGRRRPRGRPLPGSLVAVSGQFPQGTSQATCVRSRDPSRGLALREIDPARKASSSGEEGRYGLALRVVGDVEGPLLHVVAG